MLYLNFARVLKLKGILHPFTYLQTIGYSGGYATKLANNRIQELNINRLEKFCRDFNCTPNDIIDFIPNSNDSIPQDHVLHSLTKKAVDDISTKISNLPIEKIQLIHEMIKNME